MSKIKIPYNFGTFYQKWKAHVQWIPVNHLQRGEINTAPKEWAWKAQVSRSNSGIHNAEYSIQTLQRKNEEEEEEQQQQQFVFMVQPVHLQSAFVG
jgi:uncharacterized cysteine cluster protein YcgN (CxxCxxCC family)